MVKHIIRKVLNRCIRLIPYRVRVFFPRIFSAMRYFNNKYPLIIKWALSSREVANYTYDLTSENLEYLAFTIALATKQPFKKICEFIHEAKEDEDLEKHVLAKTRTSNFRYMADLRCEFGRRLGWYAIVRATMPKVVIETGVDKGLGAVLLCSALLRNRSMGFIGRYVGTDIDCGAGYLLDGKYKEVGNILYGDSIESLKRFNGIIDVFIHDSNHSPDYEYGEYIAIMNKLNDSSIILSDNSHDSYSLAQFSKKHNRKFLFFHEVPKHHWYPGAGIGISF